MACIRETYMKKMPSIYLLQCRPYKMMRIYKHFRQLNLTTSWLMRFIMLGPAHIKKSCSILSLNFI